MSKATKRKHVTKEILEEYYVPEDNEEIVKIVAGRGNNLHEVLAANGKQYLVSMPTKFRKNVWVKRGDYVIVCHIEEGVKVQGEIVYILYNKQIKYLKNEKLWPEAFEDERKEEASPEKTTSIKTDSSAQDQSSDSEEESSDNDDDLFLNPNHRPVIHQSEEDTEDEETSSSEEDDRDEDEFKPNEQRDGENNLISGETAILSVQMDKMNVSETQPQT